MFPLADVVAVAEAEPIAPMVALLPIAAPDEGGAEVVAVEVPIGALPLIGAVVAGAGAVVGGGAPASWALMEAHAVIRCSGVI